MITRKKIPYGMKIPVKLTERELELIRKEIFYDPDFDKLAVANGKCIRVEMSLAEIEEIQGFVAVEANHTKNKKIQKKLDQLADKLQVVLNTSGYL